MRPKKERKINFPQNFDEDEIKSQLSNVSKKKENFFKSTLLRIKNDKKSKDAKILGDQPKSSTIKENLQNWTIGNRTAHYRLKEKLGSGNCGVVYSGVRLSDEKKVS